MLLRRRRCRRRLRRHPPQRVDVDIQTGASELVPVIWRTNLYSPMAPVRTHRRCPVRDEQITVPGSTATLCGPPKRCSVLPLQRTAPPTTSPGTDTPRPAASTRRFAGPFSTASGVNTSTTPPADEAVLTNTSPLAQSRDACRRLVNRHIGDVRRARRRRCQQTTRSECSHQSRRAATFPDGPNTPTTAWALLVRSSSAPDIHLTFTRDMTRPPPRLRQEQVFKRRSSGQLRAARSGSGIELVHPFTGAGSRSVQPPTDDPLPPPLPPPSPSER